MEGRRQGETAWESAGGVLQGSSRSSAHTDGCAHLEEEVPKRFALCLPFRPTSSGCHRPSGRLLRRLLQSFMTCRGWEHCGRAFSLRGKRTPKGNEGT